MADRRTSVRLVSTTADCHIDGPAHRVPIDAHGLARGTI
jgi:hypothetical protein